MKLINSLILGLSAINIATATSFSDEHAIKRFIKTSLNQRQQTNLRIANVATGEVNTKVGKEEDAKLLFNTAGLAYCLKSQIMASNGTYSKNISNGFKVLGVFNDKEFQTRSFLAEITEKKQLVMSFRGTINNKNWESNFDLELVQLDDRKNIFVHQGFKKIANSMAPKAISYLQTLLTDSKYSDYTLVVTGHSLGAAIATLSVMKYQETLQLPWERIHLLTFGSPRVGNRRFANWINSKPMFSTRVVNGNDPVPKLLGGNYRHVQTEMYIRNGKSVICGTKKFEDENCSLSAEFVIDGTMHRMAWGIAMDQKYC